MEKLIVKEESANPPEELQTIERNNELRNNFHNKFIITQSNSDPPNSDIQDNIENIVAKVKSLLEIKTEKNDEAEDYLAQPPTTSSFNRENNKCVEAKLEMDELIIKDENDDQTENPMTTEGNNLNNKYIIIQSDSDPPRIYIRDRIVNIAIKVNPLLTDIDCVNQMLACYVIVGRFPGLGDTCKMQNRVEETIENEDHISNGANLSKCLNSVEMKLEVEELIIKDEDEDPTEDPVTTEGNNLSNKYIIIQSDSDPPRIYIRDRIANVVIKVNQSITEIDRANKMLACYVRVAHFPERKNSGIIQNGVEETNENEDHISDRLSMSNGKCFGQSEILKKHTGEKRMIVHKGKRPFRCSQCDKVFTYKSNLKTHILAHKKPFKCNQCDKYFGYIGNLRSHMLIHRSEKPFKCSQCDKGFAYKWNLKTHILAHKKTFKCNQCDKYFGYISSLRSHMLIHRGRKPFKCSQCDKVFTYSSGLKRHMLIHKGEKPFKCDQCDKDFRESTHLKIHKLWHQGEKPLKCNHCDKAFRQLGSLKTHMFFHEGEKPFKCSQCDRAFAQKCRLKRHELSHTGGKPFKCKQCDKAFTRVGNLNIHKLFHQGERPFKCNDCDKAFRRNGELNRHMLLHKDDKPFKCSQCDKTFVQSYKLNRHKLIHEVRKRIKCTKCRKSFFDACNLKRHMLVHKGEKPFKCSQCDKAFSHNYLAKKHEIIHKRQKPFKCDQCDMAFTANHNLKRHNMIVHKGNKL